ncbi:MAG: hypothetical protein ABIE03_02960, partial [Patescibacteria group bacterium]
PEKIACEYGYQMKKCFYKFPILFYDTITSAESNPIFSPGHYLPDEVKKFSRMNLERLKPNTVLGMFRSLQSISQFLKYLKIATG